MDEDDLATAQTVDDGAGQATVDIAVAGASAGRPLNTQTLQSTVLPRVEVVEGVPRLVREARPRFSVLEKLGEGGVGEVLKAHDGDIGRDVAIKRLRTANETGVARFVEEMRVTGALDHPNVVPIHDVGVDADGEYFFVMRHVRGETLENIISRLAAGDAETHRRFGVERRVDIFRGVLEAIAYAHSRGIIHRDIKPANIMVGPYGEVVVMDWGIAKPIRHEVDLAQLGVDPDESPPDTVERAFQTQAGALVGTPAYMAPEQVRGQPVDERTDVYALTVMLHEMLYLEHYLATEKSLVAVCNGVVNTHPPNRLVTGHPLQPAVPADLYWIIQKGMKKDPDERFQSVQEMLDRLDRRNEGEVIVQCPSTFSRRVLNDLVRTLDRRPKTFLASASLFVVAFIALVVAAIVR